MVTVIHTDTLPRLQRALEEAERIFQQLSVEQYQVCPPCHVRVMLLLMATNRVV